MTYGHDLLECCKVMQGCSQYFTPLQFTGLHDKNGKEIYEGDVFGNDLLRCHIIRKENGEWIATFRNKRIKDISILDRKIKASIIIGNIYENPELLQEKGGEG